VGVIVTEVEELGQIVPELRDLPMEQNLQESVAMQGFDDC